MSNQLRMGIMSLVLTEVGIGSTGVGAGLTGSGAEGLPKTKLGSVLRVKAVSIPGTS